MIFISTMSFINVHRKIPIRIERDQPLVYNQNYSHWHLLGRFSRFQYLIENFGKNIRERECFTSSQLNISRAGVFPVWALCRIFSLIKGNMAIRTVVNELLSANIYGCGLWIMSTVSGRQWSKSCWNSWLVRNLIILFWLQITVTTFHPKLTRLLDSLKYARWWRIMKKRNHKRTKSKKVTRFVFIHHLLRLKKLSNLEISFSTLFLF